MENITIKGKYTSAVIYASTYEDECISQIYDIINNPAFNKQTVRLMPDMHVGASGPCGLVATIGDYVCPGHIGVDIGCSVTMLKLSSLVKDEDIPLLEKRVKDRIPMGMTIHEKNQVYDKEFYAFLTTRFRRAKSTWPEALSGLPDLVDEKWVSLMIKRIGIDPAVFWKSLGTIGGGNHFIEYGVSEDKTYGAITMHFGSRNFGKRVCEHWMKRTSQPMTKSEARELTARLREEWRKTHKRMDGFQDYMKQELANARKDFIKGYLCGEDLKGYLCDMVLAQSYAEWNHIMVERILADILKKFNIKIEDSIFCTHNYIDMVDHRLRKSAISAKKGENVLVPLNMRDGVLICEGLGNEEWLSSCSHGAGRKMSRSKAKQTFSMEEFTSTMKGIYSTSVVEDTLDESPMAYKDSDEIIERIQETVKIIDRVFPQISWKATK